MKAWAEGNMEDLDPLLNTIRMMRDNATVVRDVANWVSGIEESFAQLKIAMPPLVEYDLLESDFTIILPDEG